MGNLSLGKAPMQKDYYNFLALLFSPGVQSLQETESGH